MWISAPPSGAGAGLGPNATVTATGAILTPDGTVVQSAATVTVVFPWNNTTQDVHELLAEALRDARSDPDLVVVFLDSAGTY